MIFFLHKILRFVKQKGAAMDVEKMLAALGEILSRKYGVTVTVTEKGDKDERDHD